MHDILILAAGIFVGFQGPVYLSNLFRYLQNKAILKDIVPHDVNEKKLCKGPTLG